MGSSRLFGLSFLSCPNCRHRSFGGETPPLSARTSGSQTRSGFRSSKAVIPADYVPLEGTAFGRTAVNGARKSRLPCPLASAVPSLAVSLVLEELAHNPDINELLAAHPD